MGTYEAIPLLLEICVEFNSTHFQMKFEMTSLTKRMSFDELCAEREKMEPNQSIILSKTISKIDGMSLEVTYIGPKPSTIVVKTVIR